MIETLALLFGLQVSQIDIIPPAPPPKPPTLEDVNLPIFEISCKLIDKEGQISTLGLLQEGGRGYEKPNEQNKFAIFRSTPITYKVLEDSVGQFDGLTINGEWVSQRSPLRLSARRVHGDGGLTMLRFEPQPKGQSTISIDYGGVSGIQYVGHCRLDRKSQAPLSPEETKEFLK
jgi:hypothetical protein